MKTYYGQMTKEQLNKTYFVPETLEEMIAFIDMCEKAGCNAMARKPNEVFPIGIGFFCDFNIQFSSKTAVYENDRYMVRINWKPTADNSSLDLKAQLAEAIAKRDKRKAKLQKAADKLEQAEKEVHRLIAELENDVESIGGISCKIAEMTKPEIPEGVDVDDPRTWQKGDIVECLFISSLDTLAERCFTVGRLYAVDSVREDAIKIAEDDESGRHDVWIDAVKFRFVRRP